MKTSKTPDGQISVDLWVPKTQRGQNIATAICLALVVATPIVVVLCYQMNQIGMPISSLLRRSSPEQAVAIAPPPAPAPEPTPDPNAVLSTVGQPLGDYHVMAFDQYTVAMATTDGMTEWLLQIEQGYSDGNISLIMTPYFEMQPEPVRAEVAQILLDAWQTIYTKEETLGVTISLFDRQGNSLGRSRIDGKIIFEDS